MFLLRATEFIIQSLKNIENGYVSEFPNPKFYKCTLVYFNELNSPAFDSAMILHLGHKTGEPSREMFKIERNILQRGRMISLQANHILLRLAGLLPGEQTGPAEEIRQSETTQAFYGGWGAERLLEIYREDLARAKSLEAAYVVFHVSDVSIEEGYTYRWRHSCEEVIDTSVEIVNALLAEETGGSAFLVENQWWPGFTMTAPALTEWLLDDIRYPNKGVMLDTGHLLNTNPSLETEAEGISYIHEMLDRHGGLCRYIRGLHFHQSLSGSYVRQHTGTLPEDLPKSYVDQFGVSYRHILQIDRHRPWTVPEAASIVERLAPEYLPHELAAGNRAARRPKFF